MDRRDRFQYEGHHSRYRDSHYKDKTVLRPVYLYNGISCAMCQFVLEHISEITKTHYIVLPRAYNGEFIASIREESRFYNKGLSLIAEFMSFSPPT